MGAKGGYKDLTNQIFGDFKAIEFDNSKGKYKYYWICECVNCGYTKSIASSILADDNKNKRCDNCNKDFGLRDKETITGYAKDLTGQRYGKFTILRFSHSEHSHSHWEAVCDCGNKEIHAIGYYNKNSEYKMCKECKKAEAERVSLEINKVRQREKQERKEYRETNKEMFLTRKKFNSYEFKDDIVIVNGKIIIDKEDFEFIDNLNRYLTINSGNYAYITKYGEDIFIHRLLMGLPNTFDEETRLVADHINGNRLDNRKSNLRVIKKEINPINCKKYKNNTSGVKGVSWMKKLNKWQSSIQVNKKSIYLGVYSDFDEAVRVRREAEKKYFGEYNREENINEVI